MNTQLDIQSINIPSIIKTGQYERLTSSVKNYEDTLHKLLSNGKQSSMINDPFVYIWEIDEELFPNFKDNMKDICAKLFGDAYAKINDSIVITGPYVRSCLIESVESSVVKIKKEISIFRCCDDLWNDIIDISIFTNKKTEYVFEDDTIKVSLLKKQYKHPAHVILQENYLQRVGYCNEKYYVSSMFLMEIQKHLHLLNSKFSDPVLSIPYDPLDIYQSKDKDKIHPVKIINHVDIDELHQVSKKNLAKQYNGKTCMELCLDKIMATQHPVIINQLMQIIMFLGSIHFKRHPVLYADMIGLKDHHESIYTYIKKMDCYYNVDIENVLGINKFNTIEEIDAYIIEQLIKKDHYKNFIDYIHFSKCKINKSIINNIIKHNSEDIMTNIIK